MIKDYRYAPQRGAQLLRGLQLVLLVSTSTNLCDRITGIILFCYLEEDMVMVDVESFLDFREPRP